MDLIPEARGPTYLLCVVAVATVTRLRLRGREAARRVLSDEACTRPPWILRVIATDAPRPSAPGVIIMIESIRLPTSFRVAAFRLFGLAEVAGIVLDMSPHGVFVFVPCVFILATLNEAAPVFGIHFDQQFLPRPLRPCSRKDRLFSPTLQLWRDAYRSPLHGAPIALDETCKSHGQHISPCFGMNCIND